MKTISISLPGLFATLIMGITLDVDAATRAKADNSDSLNLPSSWTNNAVPNNLDVAQFDSVVTGPLTLALGADTNWNQLSFVNPAGDITINAGNRLTLSNNTPITFGSGAANLTLNCDVFCAGTGFATLASPAAGRTLTLGGVVQGRNATVTLGNNNGTLRLGSASSTLIGTNVQVITAGLKVGLGASSVGDPVTSGPLGTNQFSWNAPAAELSTYNGAQSLANRFFLQTTLVFNSTDPLTFSGLVDLNNGSRTITVSNTGVLRFTGTVTNATGIVKTGPGILELGGTNVAVFGSGLSILGGMVRLLSNNVIPDGASAGTLRMTSVTEVLDLNGFSDTVRGVAGSGGAGNFGGTIDNSVPGTTSTLTLGDIFTYTIAGNLQNSGLGAKLALVKVGTGGLILTNSQSFSGGITNASTGLLFINSPGAAGTGPIVLTATNAEISYTGGGSLTWTNDIILATNTQPVISANDNNTLTIAGIISGPGMLRRTSALFQQGMLIFSGDNTFTGGFLLYGGVVTLSHPRAVGRGLFTIGDATFTAPSMILIPGVDLSGANSITNPVVLNRNLIVGGTNRVELSGPVTLATTAPQPSINVTNLAGAVISGPIGGPGFGLNKNGAGLLTLDGVSTYDGTTTISSGPLAFGAGGAVPNSAQILVGGTGLLDVTAKPNFTIGTAQVLTGTGRVRGNVTVNGGLSSLSLAAAFTFSNNLTLTATSTTTVNINRNAPLIEKILCFGTLSYGGTLIVNNFGAAPQAGDVFDIIGFTGSPGTFANFTLPVLNSGLVWNTSNLGVDGTLRVESAPSGPQLSNPVLLNPSNFVMTASGGTSNAQFRVLSETNLLIPVTNWPAISTNTFNGSGSLTITNPVSPVDPQRFFRIVQP